MNAHIRATKWAAAALVSHGASPDSRVTSALMNDGYVLVLMDGREALVKSTGNGYVGQLFNDQQPIKIDELTLAKIAFLTKHSWEFKLPDRVLVYFVDEDGDWGRIEMKDDTITLAPLHMMLGASRPVMALS